MKKYDVIVIGGGPAGYTAAIKLAQLGKNVACVDKRDYLGGTCLNVGCIPSKALLQSSHKFSEATQHMSEHGIEIGSVSLSLTKMMERKNKVVTDLARGIDSLFRKNKITRIIGLAKFINPTTISIEANGSQEQITADSIVIATGSEVTPLPGVEVDEKVIVSSTGALELHDVPKKLLVIGAGVIGLEMGSIWARLGSEVIVVEYADRILSTMDEDISREAEKIFSAQGIKFRLATKVIKATTNKIGATIEIQQLSSNHIEKLDCDIILSAVGRRSYSNGLNLDAAGVELDDRRRIIVGQDYQTSAKGIYAIGDVISGPMLAHKAEEEGIAAAENIVGQHGHVNYNAIPSIVYTNPEIAAVGKGELELKNPGIEYKVGKFPFSANSRARTNSESFGFTKIITGKTTDKILGAQIIGPNAGDLIVELVLAMEFGASAEDVARTSHGHPSLSEAIKEAALSAYDRAIHI